MMKVKTGSDSARSSGVITAHNRFTFETELTFAPKLNATSIRLAKERQSKYNPEQQRLVSSVGAVPAVVNRAVNSTPNLDFSFKPRMSSTSVRIAENLGTTFMARQELHLQKQRQLIEQSKVPPFRARLSPVTLHRVKKQKEKENVNSSQQLAWGTPNSTPNILDCGRKHTDLDGVKVGIVGSVSMHSNMLNPVRSSKHQLQRLTEGPYSSTGSSSAMKKQKPVLPKTNPSGFHKRSTTHPPEDTENACSTNQHVRSKTASSPEMSPRRSKYNLKRLSNSGSLTFDKMQTAKICAEKAIKLKKVFSIQGPYPVVRECLRNREWVEKQYRSMAPHSHKAKKTATSDYDSDDSDNDDDQDQDNGCHGDSDDEENFPGDSDGLYGTMSRVVRNATPNFMWTCRRDSIDFKLLRKDTIVNHFAKNGSFTTKVGLCTNLRNLHWFDNLNPDEFFPRCYKVCNDEERTAFIDDYRLTAAISILKWVVQNRELDINLEDMMLDEKAKCQSPEATPHPQTNESSKCSPKVQSPKTKKKEEKKVLQPALVETAQKVVETFLGERDHEDIDIGLDTPPVLTAKEWEDFILQYYQLIFDDGIISEASQHIDYSQALLNRLRNYLPQIDLDGVKNVWIIKPGAKSRGRGIMCMNRLEDIVKLVGNPIVQKEGKWVVQKYIERPLLVYNTKFDIRQWFLVTDWNALTVWFYKDCYLRFCTQPYTLDDFDTAIHLSNQSVQKHYTNNPTRCSELPEDNMWTNTQFIEYLEERDCGNVWMDLVYPGMKRAIVDALLCAQDIVEPRKHSFEVYGADFMLTEDFKPWLIEINSSPAMGATTKITEQMCFDVIEDTMKIVLDRRQDKSCDTGHFELAFKQPQGSAPPYIGMNLSVEGTAIKKPGYLSRQKSTANMFTYRNPDSMRLHTERTKIMKESKAGRESRDMKEAQMSKSTTSLEEVQKKLAEQLSATQHRLRIRRSNNQIQLVRTEIATMTRIVCPFSH
ncbi:tubulin monoglycylase TTLL3-like isoform X3 [Anneissia japonica]|uniref:tubulin monoglycylase TTLL3-like isoform X3 n=1 Tax=Anneissia japonica TaxID=1529436 RepID=UPI0014257908|nr:tubulin monoglycylase TTLL3-like isoform X3 [Anneissia japonica]